MSTGGNGRGSAAARRAEAQDEGFDYFDWLGCVDEIGRSDTFRVVLVLRRTGFIRGRRMLDDQVPREARGWTIRRGSFAGAGWHEREAAELFGIEFVGGDRRRLLLGADIRGRSAAQGRGAGGAYRGAWPGAKEPGETDASPSRRRMVPPGVPDPDIWGDRDPAVAGAEPGRGGGVGVGGRVRRRPMSGMARGTAVSTAARRRSESRTARSG